jgi:hypothetical protein
MVLYGVLGLALFAWLVVLIGRWPVIGFVLLSAALVVAWEAPSLPTLASIAGVRISAEDALSSALLVVGCHNLISGRLGRSSFRGTVIGLAALLLWALARGVLEYGLEAASNEGRSFFELIAACFWAASLDWSSPQLAATWRRVAFGTSWCLVVVAAYHLVAYGLGDAISFVYVDGMHQTGRPLVASQALAVGLVYLWSVHSWATSRSMAGLVQCSIFGSVVILAQHRTVWVAVAVGMLALVLVTRQVGARAFMICAVGLVSVGIAAAAISPVGSELRSSASNEGTYADRTTGWSELIDESVRKGGPSVAVGSAFGTGYARMSLNGQVSRISPHNWYVATYLRTGLLGVGCLLVIILLVGSRVIRSRNAVAFATLIGLIVFCWAYALPWLVGIFVGRLMQIRPAGAAKVRSICDDALAPA